MDLESNNPPTMDKTAMAATNEESGISSNTNQSTTDQQRNALALQVEGWRRTVLLTAVFIGLFLSFLDTTIVSVALTTIADQFGDYDHSAWVITAYLLTYMAFAIIITRLSDVFGRRAVEIASFVIFIAFSLGCALSQSMTELIVFRAFQGIGGSGLFSMTMVIALNAVAPQTQGMISGIVGGIMVISGVLGPVLSGAITGSHGSGSTWRWIFYLNLPVGGLALGALIVAWPKDKKKTNFAVAAFKSIDFLGCLLLLAASILLVFSLQEAGSFVYAWKSGTIIACLIVSGSAFIVFVAWQEWLTRYPNITTRPVFPVRSFKQRVIGGAMLVTLLTGFNFYIAVVNLPQRFQIVDHNSPVLAGVKLLPMMISSAIGSFTGGGINTKRNFTSYTLMVSSSFQLLGYGLMTTLGNANPTPHSQFGFQVFFGLGFGLAVSSVTILVQLAAEPRWIAVTQGALTQMRSLGGSLGLAIGVIVFNYQIRGSNRLTEALSAAQMSSLIKSPLAISSFTRQQQGLVSEVYAQAFTQEMKVATYVSAACFVASLLTWQKNPPQRPLTRAPEVESKKSNTEEIVHHAEGK